MEDRNKAYWEDRFSTEGKIWGEFPSNSAIYALKLFKKYDIRNILIPGSGYGRHTKLFSDNHYNVVGVEISEIAVEMAKSFNPQTTFINCSVLEMDTVDDKFDAIYCFNLLHLFLKEDRQKLIKQCYNRLNSKGLVFFTAFSEGEPSYGRGKELESHTFESKPGRPTHYFLEEDLINHFNEFKIIKTDIIKEQENHGERGKHTHSLRYLFGQRVN
ncbi:MAG: class I SAM-dependent methyltransferase [Candidatus Thorarchaeota archaeon]